MAGEAEAFGNRSQQSEPQAPEPADKKAPVARFHPPPPIAFFYLQKSILDLFFIEKYSKLYAII